uniref:RNA helicase n=1 Tax=viral metagenome TaxID=1070528 RepID=A0A6C0C2H6_9ZZZZ
MNYNQTKEEHYIKDWEDSNLNLKKGVLRGIYAFGFEKPSSIQQKAILPFVKKNSKGERKDIVAQAQSGTGKTGCFVVSMLQIINENLNKTQAMILAPTHELAEQIAFVVNGLGHYLKIKTQLLIGGKPVEKDKKDLEDNQPHVVVGTPGRVQDLIRRKWLNVNTLQLLVIDEADEMLSTGFQEQMYKIFQFMPENIQIGLFSATMPVELEELTKAFLRKPTKILVKSEELTLQGIAQYYISLIDDQQKYECIKDLFSNLSITQAIIYCNSTRRVDDLTEAMKTDEFPVEKIHGKMAQSERREIHKEFKNGRCRVLITSDLFARGIDVQQVSIVINFDIPKNEHTYLHRIGRSGRWGRKGIAINFQTKYDIQRIKKFEEYYETKIMEMPGNYAEHLQTV